MSMHLKYHITSTKIFKVLSAWVCFKREGSTVFAFKIYHTLSSNICHLCQIDSSFLPLVQTFQLLRFGGFSIRSKLTAVAPEPAGWPGLLLLLRRAQTYSARTIILTHFELLCIDGRVSVNNHSTRLLIALESRTQIRSNENVSAFCVTWARLKTCGRASLLRVENNCVYLIGPACRLLYRMSCTGWPHLWKWQKVEDLSHSWTRKSVHHTLWFLWCDYTNYFCCVKVEPTQRKRIFGRLNLFRSAFQMAQAAKEWSFKRLLTGLAQLFVRIGWPRLVEISAVESA